MHDLPDLINGLKRSPSILSEFVRTIPEAKLDEQRGKSLWCISDHVKHLTHVQPMLLERIIRCIEEECPIFTPYIPGKENLEPSAPQAKKIPEALTKFSQYRKRQLEILENIKDESLWQKQAQHPEYKQYSLYILTRHILMHDYLHMYRIEELWLTKEDYFTK